MLKNKKGYELPINILVTLALVVFVVFLVLGFLTGGWGYFAGIFGKTTKTQTGLDAARQDCKSTCTQYVNEGTPEISLTDTSDYWYVKLISTKTDYDLDGDGKFDAYSCRGDVIKTTARVLLVQGNCPIMIGVCEGTYAVKCSDYTDETKCIGEAGCTAKGDCALKSDAQQGATCDNSGTGKTKVQCEADTDCTWAFKTCDGTPTFSCTTPAAKTACTAKSGCMWTKQSV